MKNWAHWTPLTLGCFITGISIIILVLMKEANTASSQDEIDARHYRTLCVTISSRVQAYEMLRGQPIDNPLTQSSLDSSILVLRQLQPFCPTDGAKP